MMLHVRSSIPSGLHLSAENRYSGTIYRPRPSQSRNASISFGLSSSSSSRFTYTKAYKNLLNELGDQAGQHEVIAENLSTQVVHELNALVKQLKDDRRKVSMSM